MNDDTQLTFTSMFIEMSKVLTKTFVLTNKMCSSIVL